MFEEEGRLLVDTVLDVKHKYSVLVHECRENCKRHAGLGNSSDGDGSVNTGLTFLNTQSCWRVWPEHLVEQ